MREGEMFISNDFAGEILMGQFFLPCYYSFHTFGMTWVTTHMGCSVRYVHAHRSLQVIPELINECSFRNSHWGQRQESELQTHILGSYSTHIWQTVILLKPNLQFAFKRYNLNQFWEGAGKEITVLSLIMVEYKIALLSMQACGVAKWFLLAYRVIVCFSSPACGLVVLDPFRKMQLLAPEMENFSIFLLN